MLLDLTHPVELLAFARLGGQVAIGAVVAVLALGLVLAVFARALQGQEPALAWARGYDRLLRGLPHAALALALLAGLGAACLTLANRAHHWELDRLAAHTHSVEGDRMEQPAPSVRYQIEEPYTVQVVQDGKRVDVKRTHTYRRTVPLAGSDIVATVDQVADPIDASKITYKLGFTADFDVANPLLEAHHFELVVPRPSGTTLLSGFKVERDGQRLTPVADDPNAFALDLAPGQHQRFHLSYQSQGGPRWIYDAGGEPLSNFKLTTKANVPDVRYASGVAPTTISTEGAARVYTWAFQDNVAVANPFGIFSAVGPVAHEGVVPRLLLLAPGVCAWWLLVLYATAPPRLRQLPVAVAGFFAIVLTLDYLSRTVPTGLAWAVAALGLLALAYCLEGRLRGVIATGVAAALPLLALVLDHTGLTLSLAAVASAAWMAVSNRRPVGIREEPLTR